MSITLSDQRHIHVNMSSPNLDLGLIQTPKNVNLGLIMRPQENEAVGLL